MHDTLGKQGTIEQRDYDKSKISPWKRTLDGPLANDRAPRQRFLRSQSIANLCLCNSWDIYRRQRLEGNESTRRERERYVNFRFEYVGRSCGMEPPRGFRVMDIRTE